MLWLVFENQNSEYKAGRIKFCLNFILPTSFLFLYRDKVGYSGIYRGVV